MRKKAKSQGFAAPVNREDLVKGAKGPGVDLEEHIAFAIEAMSSIAETLGLVGTAELVADEDSIRGAKREANARHWRQGRGETRLHPATGYIMVWDNATTANTDTPTYVYRQRGCGV